jgi:hypothetical protein
MYLTLTKYLENIKEGKQVDKEINSRLSDAED